MALRIRIERSTPAHARTVRRRGLTVAGTTVAAVLAVSGVSYAFWSATGTGTATVGSVTAQALTVSASSPVVSDLYPGKTAQALTYTVTNPNPYVVTVNSASVGAVTSSDPTNCPTSNLATVPSGPFAQGFDVPANGTAVGSIAGIVQMLGSAGNGCQGKTFTYTVTLSGTQK